MDSDRYRLQIWYGGHVQGVGFRFKAAQIAKGYDVSGFVRNLDDGRVHLAAVGDPKEVREFVSELSRVMSDFIRSAEIDFFSLQCNILEHFVLKCGHLFISE